MTDRSNQFYTDVLHRLGRVFASYQLDQAEAVAICAQLTVLAIGANANQAAQPEQLEKTIQIIRERYRVIAEEPISDFAPRR